MGQLLHLDMPGKNLLGLVATFSGTLALISLSFMFGGRLNATNGGSGNTSLRWGSLLTMVLQCFLIILGMEGSLGSYVTTNTGRLVSLLFSTLFNAICLGVSRAFLIAAVISFSL